MTTWVLVADSARARIFDVPSPSGALREREDRIHPSSRASSQGLMADAPGRVRARARGGSHTLGQEQDARDDEAERFARELAGTLCEARRDGRLERLHVIAAPAFLGRLRPHLDDATRACIVSELDANVTDEDPQALRTRLPDRL